MTGRILDPNRDQLHVEKGRVQLYVDVPHINHLTVDDLAHVMDCFIALCRQMRVNPYEILDGRMSEHFGGGFRLTADGPKKLII